MCRSKVLFDLIKLVHWISCYTLLKRVKAFKGKMSYWVSWVDTLHMQVKIWIRKISHKQKQSSPVKHLRWSFFRKKLHLRCFSGFWINFSWLKVMLGPNLIFFWFTQTSFPLTQFYFLWNWNIYVRRYLMVLIPWPLFF